MADQFNSRKYDRSLQIQGKIKKKKKKKDCSVSGQEINFHQS